MFRTHNTKETTGDGRLKKEYESGKYPLEIPTLEDFTEDCYFDDLRHYRAVYFQAFKLWPQYEKAIRGGSDWPEYLIETEEDIDQYFDAILTRELGWFENSPDQTEEWRNNIIYKNNKSRKQVKKICSFLNNEGG